MADRFFNRAGAGSHDDDDALGVGRAHVVEEMVGAAGEAREFVHDVLHDGRAGEIERIAGFAGLKEDVGILRCAAKDRMVRREGALAMSADKLLVEQGADGLVGDCEGLVDLVRCAEAVEEMHEGDARFERRDVRDERHVAGFLHGVRREHRITRRPAGHHVRVVAEDRERVRGDGARRDVNDVGGELACDLEQVGDH